MTIANLQTLTNFLIGTTSTELSNANFLIFLNQAYERIVGKIIKETIGSRRQFGDFNYTSFPNFSINLTNGTQSYSLSSIATNPLTIMGIEVLDSNGNQHVLYPTSLQEIHEMGIAFDQYYSTNGLPIEYEIRDNLIVLYPTPATASVTLTNGLIIYYLRTADVFTEAQRNTGTKEPGFPSPYHDILAYETAYVFAISKGLSNILLLNNERERKERELLDFILKRNQNDRPVMSMEQINYF